MLWIVEDIPNEDVLYMRIHRAHFKRDGSIASIAWATHGGGMSTNWCKYSSPESTRDDARKVGKDPTNYAVIALPVGEVRQIPDQVVQHTPMDDNRAHTDVFGRKDEEAFVKFGRINTIKLHLEK